MIVDAMRWATAKVDESVVNPVASRLANSVANPAVLSFLLWDQLKTLTPQRARDLTRLLATALSNALGVFGAERGQQLGASTKQLQEDFVRAASSRAGRDVVLNSVATVAKVAQALNTPEIKAATQQLFQTLQSVVDFFASDDGRRIISGTGECIKSASEMAASPESSIFLAELATNLLHTLESEERRRKDACDVKEEGQEEEEEHELSTDEKQPYSPASSVADTSRGSFDTESTFSEALGTPWTDMYAPRASEDTLPSPVRPGPRHRASLTSPAEKNGNYRSACIEKEVLLKMGVDPSMLNEFQRVLDVIATSEEAKERAEEQRQREEAEYVAGLIVPDNVPAVESGIAHAFGHDDIKVKSEEIADDNYEEKSPTPVLLPEWHEQLLREALRRRHAHAEDVTAQRHSAERQAHEMAMSLAQRHIRHGELQPADIVACRLITRMIVYSVCLFLLVSSYMVTRSLFG
ncbi:hypothetical protein PHYBOEH_010035 [Phytophthora boehmeriae]|uniref:Uncharacterized protein n=1 Tax=Phytophthora boehmeriae TaxID=109152 RepID=A0A8T1X5P8_9STRA|nr:hypothetical protein PHYBOEH_010035 [Phytophthora boehmeriae]